MLGRQFQNIYSNKIQQMQAIDDGMKNKEQDEGKGRGGHATMITCCNPSLHPFSLVGIMGSCVCQLVVSMHC